MGHSAWLTAHADRTELSGELEAVTISKGLTVLQRVQGHSGGDGREPEAAPAHCLTVRVFSVLSGSEPLSLPCRV